jgi:hypothetical protein
MSEIVVADKGGVACSEWRSIPPPLSTNRAIR